MQRLLLILLSLSLVPAADAALKSKEVSSSPTQVVHSPPSVVHSPAPVVHSPTPVVHSPPPVVHPQSSAGILPGSSRGYEDIHWFGGDDGSGLAYEDGVWDWDTIVSDPLQAWESFDQTTNPAVYFGWVVQNDFTSHGDPCTPTPPDDWGMLWCGIHEDEADDRDFVTGMGYQNGMNQSAFSPRYDIDSETTIDLSFSYFNDTEEDYDYTHVYILCYDSSDELIDEHLLDSFTDIIGSFPSDPASYVGSVPAGTLDYDTDEIQIEFRMVSDGSYSDEDGDYDCACGPFAVDDITIGLSKGRSTTRADYHFDDGPEGWTFAKKPGAGTYMSVVPESEWSLWLESAGVTGYNHTGNVLSLVDRAGSPFYPPGLDPEQNEVAISGIVPRTGYFDHNTVLVRLDTYRNGNESCAIHRFGFMYYPFTTVANPTPRWSPTCFDRIWYTFDSRQGCRRRQIELSALPDNLPADWDSLRFCIQIDSDCWLGRDGGTRSQGETYGAPIYDNVQVGLAHLGGPIIAPAYRFQDGFGQRFPEFLTPGDVGNANVSLLLHWSTPGVNRWLADSAVVRGGPVPTNPAERWLAELCFKIERKGAYQDMVPGYQSWKSRFTGDPEDGFVCVLLDSLELPPHPGACSYMFATYFHEDDIGFDHGYPDYCPQQEVLPDSFFSPGTQIRYYFRSFWYDNYPNPAPDEYYTCGLEEGWEFEILPGMRLDESKLDEYAVHWPSVLYVSAHGSQTAKYYDRVLEDMPLTYDRYDYLLSTDWSSGPMKRSFGGTHFNPGGYGNSGCTLEQLLGYRLIILDTGNYDTESGWGDALKAEDIDLIDEWLTTAECELRDVRRGLILAGEGITEIIDSYDQAFLNDTLGATLTHGCLRDGASYDECTLQLEPYGAIDPICVYGNCPRLGFCFDILGLQAGVPGVATGSYYTSPSTQIDYASISRDNTGGSYNWRSIVHGYGLHQTMRCDDGDPDSVSIVDAMGELLSSEIAWIQAGGAPFDLWRHPCFASAVGGVDLPAGTVNYLLAGRPNPFSRQATIRFGLAASCRPVVEIFDVTGRRVRSLRAGELKAGEHSMTWDGTDEGGRPLGAGVFWMQLRLPDGYCSSRRLVRLR
ncbi:MAG: hypothetical protein KAY32_02120 [Candidatus Eisenbacteria sp.]|nr:hypothetical protein [Candidatus Eisenbacteria bacterium]